MKLIRRILLALFLLALSISTIVTKFCVWLWNTIRKALRPREEDCPDELLEEVAQILAGPGGTVQKTEDGWVYEPASATNDEVNNESLN